MKSLLNILRQSQFPGKKFLGKLLILFIILFERLFRQKQRSNAVLLKNELPPKTAKILFYVHLHSHGLPQYVQNTLSEFKKNGWSIVFINVDRELSSSDYQKVESLAEAIVQRKNIGYDFGAWRDAFQLVPSWKDAQQLILMNDSMVGPIFPLQDFLHKAESSDAEFYGLFESRELRPHLQSFVLLFKKKAIQSEAFARFWERVHYYHPLLKPYIVWRYETGITKTLVNAGFSYDALIRYEDYQQYIGKKSPTYYFWKEAIEKHGCPFIKKALLQNPRRFSQNPELLKKYRKYLEDEQNE